MLKILMIGPLPPPIGGVSVSFRILVDLLRQRTDVAIDVVDFSRIRNQQGAALSGFLSLVKAIVAKVKGQDIVMVSCSDAALATLGLFLLLLSRVLRKPLIIKKAAGLDYYTVGRWQGSIAHFVVKHADLYLAQTKFLVHQARQRGISHVQWFPTIRLSPENDLPALSSKKRCRRFVFVGQVRERKGIREIINAAERLDERIHVDIFGPFFDDLEPAVFNTCQRVRYGGVLAPEQVTATLSHYDMLLLPTKHISEGYPGAVLEAYAAGIPFITTRCGAIPEIVDEQTGLFVEAGNASALYEAMKQIIADDLLYQRLCQGVADRRREFTSAFWVNRFVDNCHSLAGANRRSLAFAAEQ
jgi:glycosyltransferase involved in cell wall biosynthesis